MLASESTAKPPRNICPPATMDNGKRTLFLSMRMPLNIIHLPFVNLSRCRLLDPYNLVRIKQPLRI